MGNLEEHFDAAFAANLALREKQIQQNYRPIIGIHKWFARRPGTLFRNLLLAEFNGDEPIDSSYWRSHRLRGVIADPFMGGGTPIFEANRLGFSVVGTDVNPMAYWVVRQALAPLDINAFAAVADLVAASVEADVGCFYRTTCLACGGQATAKYFIWVKQATCPGCQTEIDLFPGYLLAEATRHPKHVLACGHCGALNEFGRQPRRCDPEPCAACGSPVHVEGPARASRVVCPCCGVPFRYVGQGTPTPPRHRMWAIEYHCEVCRPTHVGRFFKRPDELDLANYEAAASKLAALGEELPIPADSIPAGDETDRLHRWGYSQYRQMFNDRQLLGLGLLLERIREVGYGEARHALLTVFSDFLRYQNMLCRYDTYALKCQDIFSVHGFPVGLVQCENSLLGIPGVGSGSFRHFVEKYRRAKLYCEAPFETRHLGQRKQVVPITGERIAAELVDSPPSSERPEARLLAAPATAMPLAPASLDAVFTDPPYFDNVQYAELMDFCFAWLRQGLGDEFPAFRALTTRSPDELTGNVTLGRGLEHFTEGLSAVFRHYAAALKPRAPFVFTYHHNDPVAYVPLVVAILDAGMDCTAALPAPAEMGASLHIARTNSSIVDTVFVCRAGVAPTGSGGTVVELVARDVTALAGGGVGASDGDIRCLMAGHVAKRAVNRLRESWDAGTSLRHRMNQARTLIAATSAGARVASVHTMLGEHAAAVTDVR